MSALIKVPDKGDPSEIQQLFPRFNLQLLCCRYWWLQRWEFRELSFPYWRIYHNTREGAKITFQGKEFALHPDKILMIVPNTAYSTQINNFKVPEDGFRLVGGRIGKEPEENHATKDKILHLFIHFNIGVPYDNISPGIFEFNLTENLQKKINSIKKYLQLDFSMFDFYTMLTIQSLIYDLLSSIPKSNWDLPSKDHRILHVLRHIESNLEGDLSNPALSEIARLATNAFNRLFTEETGTSPQKYVKKKRIDRACALLHHSNNSIEQVATDTGFADRYHFSKIFKQQTGLSPARYRKEFGVK